MDDIRVALVGLGRRGVDAWLPLLQHVEGYRLDIAANLFARRVWRKRWRTWPNVPVRRRRSLNHGNA
jgi:hypothetical protein